MYIVTIHFDGQSDYDEYFLTWHEAVAWMVEYAQADNHASSWELWNTRSR